jgi:putative transposase
MPAADVKSNFEHLFTRSALQKAGVQISMDGKGRALDNVFVERLWRTVKYEEVYLKAYQGTADCRSELLSYFTFYNRERPHSSLGGRTPWQVYTEGKSARVKKRLLLVGA